MKPVRVLQVVPSLNKSAGVARFVYNMTVASDEGRVHYDLMHHAVVDGAYLHDKRFDEELAGAGHEVYVHKTAAVMKELVPVPIKDTIKELLVRRGRGR